MRENLGKAQSGIAPLYPLLQEQLPQIEQKAAAVKERLAEDCPRLKEKLADTAQLRGWKVYRADNSGTALDYIYNLAVSSEAASVVRSNEEVFQIVNVDEPLSSKGIDVAVMDSSLGPAREVLRQKAADADLGITGVDYAIAETGSAVVLPRRGLSRLVSLLPPVHLAIVRRDQIVDSLEDLFILRRLAYYRGNGDMGSYMNFITGPSRTADIEQTLVIGVHGPKEVHLVLLES